MAVPVMAVELGGTVAGMPVAAMEPGNHVRSVASVADWWLPGATADMGTAVVVGEGNVSVC